MDIVQNIGKEVKLTRSCNTLLFQNETIARNTDYLGFSKSYNYHFNIAPNKVLVLGGGGVGRSVCFALGELKTKKIFLLEKDIQKSRNLVEQLRNKNINCNAVTTMDLINIQSTLDGVINCTPVGHESFLGNPLPQIKTMKNQWVYDVIYTPAKTEFLKKAEINKSKLIFGIDLFIFQGIEAFILLTHQKKLRNKVYAKIEQIRAFYFKKLIN